MTNLEHARDLQKTYGEKYDMLVKLYEMMTVGQVHFTYTKKNGEERKALGTIECDYLKRNSAEPSGNGKSKGGAMAYYDIHAEAWRSFVPENLVSIDE